MKLWVVYITEPKETRVLDIFHASDRREASVIKRRAYPKAFGFYNLTRLPAWLQEPLRLYREGQAAVPIQTKQTRPDESLLNDRKIIRRTEAVDGTTEVVFECGHITIQIVPIPKDWDRMKCAQCINQFAEDSRVKPSAQCAETPVQRETEDIPGETV